MLALVICYSLIIKTVQCTKSLKKTKSVKVVLFFLTQIPYTFFRFIKIIEWSFKWKGTFEYAITITIPLAYFYGCLNPLFLCGYENQEVLAQNC